MSSDLETRTGISQLQFMQGRKALRLHDVPVWLVLNELGRFRQMQVKTVKNIKRNFLTAGGSSDLIRACEIATRR